MNVEFDKSFLKSIERLNNRKILNKADSIIHLCKSAQNLSDIQNVKKLSGSSNFYRIKIGNYRIGFELLNKETIRFIILLHRKDIYKKFP
jgi:mRNA interferase RelE/StbE